MATYTDAQVMMTLAALAGTDVNPLPFESISHQEERILAGINTALQNQDLATGGAWQVVWVGLGPKRANMVYVARNTQANQYAVVARGTDFVMTIDRNEDFDVGTAVPFTGVSQTVHISQGSNEAYTDVTTATFTDGTTLIEKVAALAAQTPGATIYVTGHSLGGAIASMLALALSSASAGWDAGVTFQVYTFAAPTAGLDDFAALFDQTFPSNAWRYYNVWDVVPNAWQTLPNVDTYYPGGPLATDEIKKKVADYQQRTNGLAYTQPSVNPVPLNQDEVRDPKFVNDTTVDFIRQVAYQHLGSTYLSFLGAPPLSSAAVSDVSTARLAQMTGTP